MIAQYYNFIRLGREGYRRVQQACRDTAMYLSEWIAEIGPFELLSDGRRAAGVLLQAEGRRSRTTRVYDLSAKLRERGWQVPAYSLPADLEDTHVIRLVIRNGFSRDMADILLADIRASVSYFEGLSGPMPHDPAHGPSFHH